MSSPDPTAGALDKATDVVYRALYVEVNGGELEPITDVYDAEGVRLVVKQALRNGVRAYLDGLDPAQVAAALGWDDGQRGELVAVLWAIRPGGTT